MRCTRTETHFLPKSSLALIAVALVAVMSCGSPPPSSPEAALVEQAAAALGGRGEVESVGVLAIEGDGDSYWLGEARAPGFDLPVFYASFRQVFDWKNRRFRKEELRTPRFLTSGLRTQRIITALDTDIAFDVDDMNKALRLSDQASIERKAELYHHPIGAIKAALLPGTRLSNLRTEQGFDAVDVATADGAKFSVYFDRTTKRPAKAASPISHPTLGDLVLETFYSDYEDVGKLSLPDTIKVQVDRQVVAAFRVSTYLVDGVTTQSKAAALVPRPDERPRIAAPFGPIPPLEVPPVVKAAPLQRPVPPVTAEEVSPGVWYLTGGSYFSVLAEFKDHLVLIEAPLDDAMTFALLAKAKELRPQKPVTTLVVTHHHLDHVGGVRAAVSAGLRVIAAEGRSAPDASASGGASVSYYTPGSKDTLEDLLNRKHTLQPDALEKGTRPFKVETFTDKYVLQDEMRTIELYPISGSTYATTLLMAYFPNERLLVEADVYTPPDPMSPRVPYFPYAQNLLDNIQSRNLKVDRVLPLHGRMVPFDHLVEAAKRPVPAAVVPPT